jgi:hypothetical protein
LTTNLEVLCLVAVITVALEELGRRIQILALTMTTPRIIIVAWIDFHASFTATSEGVGTPFSQSLPLETLLAFARVRARTVTAIVTCFRTGVFSAQIVSSVVALFVVDAYLTLILAIDNQVFGRVTVVAITSVKSGVQILGLLINTFTVLATQEILLKFLARVDLAAASVTVNDYGLVPGRALARVVAVANTLGVAMTLGIRVAGIRVAVVRALCVAAALINRIALRIALARFHPTRTQPRGICVAKLAVGALSLVTSGTLAGVGQ